MMVVLLSTSGCSTMVSARAFQAWDGGSIPLTRSKSSIIRERRSDILSPISQTLLPELIVRTMVSKLVGYPRIWMISSKLKIVWWL